MWIGRLRRELDELSRECAGAERDEERATFELARSARAFSQHARKAGDDKLAFSATLMRAGEVEAARRLIEDFEQEVHEEHAGIAGHIDKAKAAAATRRAKMTRMRLARTLAAALTTAGLLSFSLAGVTIASFFADRGDQAVDGSSIGLGSRSGRTANPSQRDAVTRSIRLADGTTVRVTLTQHQFRRLKNLSTNSNLDRAELQRLLIPLLGPKLAERLADSIASIAKSAEQAAGEAGTSASDVKSKVTKELGARPEVTEPTTDAPGSDDHEQGAPGEPDDDTDVIDTPLGTDPETTVPDVSGD
jgi:hypothetical protein